MGAFEEPVDIIPERPRPFVSVVDPDLCAEHATFAACTSYAMYELEIAVSHAVIFEPE